MTHMLPRDYFTAADHMTEVEVRRAEILHPHVMYAPLGDIAMCDLVHYRLRDSRSAVIAADAIKSFFAWEDEDQS